MFTPQHYQEMSNQVLCTAGMQRKIAFGQIVIPRINQIPKIFFFKKAASLVDVGSIVALLQGLVPDLDLSQHGQEGVHVDAQIAHQEAVGVHVGRWGRHRRPLHTPCRPVHGRVGRGTRHSRGAIGQVPVGGIDVVWNIRK